MKSLSKYIIEKVELFKSIKDIEKFLSQFKDDETSWAGATDEIRDLAIKSRDYLKEFDNFVADEIDFKKFKTPAEWNKIGKSYIIKNFEQMSNNAKKAYLRDINNMFID